MTYKSVLDPRVVDNAVDMMRADPDVSLYDAILAQPNPDSQMWAGVSCIARIGRFETGNIKKLGDARFLEQVYGPNWHEIQGLMARVFSAAPSEKFEPTPRMVVGAAAAYEAALSSGITRFAHARNADTSGRQAGCKFDDPRMRTVCAHAALAASVRDLVGTGSVFTQEHYDDLTCSGQSHPAGLRLGASEPLAVALVPPHSSRHGCSPGRTLNIGSAQHSGGPSTRCLRLPTNGSQQKRRLVGSRTRRLSVLPSALHWTRQPT